MTQGGCFFFLLLFSGRILNYGFTGKAQSSSVDDKANMIHELQSKTYGGRSIPQTKKRGENNGQNLRDLSAIILDCEEDGFGKGKDLDEWGES